MKPYKEFRDNGAVGALLDEYERSIDELIDVITTISEDELIQIVDPETKDKDCKSIQTILSHVIGSGYTYTIEVRKWIGEDVAYKSKEIFSTVEEYKIALHNMFSYNEQLFKEFPELPLVEYRSKYKIKVRWGQKYDVEQIFEHAIVHILRHRRQIERFKLKLT